MGTKPLPIGKSIHISARLQGDALLVQLDGDDKAMGCKVHGYANKLVASQSVPVYISDPWNQPAEVTLRNVYYTSLTSDVSALLISEERSNSIDKSGIAASALIVAAVSV